RAVNSQDCRGGAAGEDYSFRFVRQWNGYRKQRHRSAGDQPLGAFAPRAWGSPYATTVRLWRAVRLVSVDPRGSGGTVASQRSFHPEDSVDWSGCLSAPLTPAAISSNFSASSSIRSFRREHWKPRGRRCPHRGSALRSRRYPFKYFSATWWLRGGGSLVQTVSTPKPAQPAFAARGAFPRETSCGPIEADSWTAFDLSYWRQFRDQLIAAPLKRRHYEGDHERQTRSFEKFCGQLYVASD